MGISMFKVDLNSDLGESFGRYTLGSDEKIIPLISSCNIACGFHAGDPDVMRKTVATAAANDCAIGAHPGYPDLQGFGRRDMALSPDEVYATIVYQIGALQGFCAAAGVTMAHVKPHGQLYNTAAISAEVSAAIVQAIRDVNPNLVIVGLANSVLVQQAEKAGMRAANEFFMDRNYTDAGSLVPRSQANAVLHDENFAIARVKEAIKSGCIASESGKIIDVSVDTICVHGDTANALAFVQKLREEFAKESIEILPL